MHKVGGNTGDIEGGVRVYVAVNNDHWNTCILCFLQNVIPPSGNHWRKNNRVNIALCNPSTHGGNLILLFLLCIGKQQVDATCFGLSLYRFGKSSTPSTF